MCSCWVIVVDYIRVVGSYNIKAHSSLIKHWIKMNWNEVKIRLFTYVFAAIALHEVCNYLDCLSALMSSCKHSGASHCSRFQ